MTPQIPSRLSRHFLARLPNTFIVFLIIIYLGVGFNVVATIKHHYSGPTTFNLFILLVVTSDTIYPCFSIRIKAALEDAISGADARRTSARRPQAFISALRS